ncbi:MAG: ion transporter [Bacteriovoracales bacterium]|nr:ion transporter [Bacteriovoracales bacterium]
MKNKHPFSSKNLNLLIQLLIIASIIQLSIETMPSLKNQYKNLFYWLEVFFIFVFSLEYFARIYFSKEKSKFIFSFYGLIDLISILPSILSLGATDTRFFRSLRLLRFFRIFKMVKYSKAMDRIKDSFSDVKEEMIIFLALSLILLYISASGIYYFEHEVQPEKFKSIPHSLWYSISTLTTVGYGDIYPITIGGKIFTFFILIIGLGFISIPSGLLASSFLRNKNL